MFVWEKNKTKEKLSVYVCNTCTFPQVLDLIHTIMGGCGCWNCSNFATNAISWVVILPSVDYFLTAFDLLSCIHLPLAAFVFLLTFKGIAIGLM